jgi:endoglucanase
MKINIDHTKLALLERLTNAGAVSGQEGPVREIVLEEIRPRVEDIRVDALGNVLARCPGKAPGERLKVMVAAHMDEVGFMLTAEEGDGLYRFSKVGGLDTRQLVGKAVRVGEQQVPGVIGAKPIHFTTAAERKKTISLDNLRIDVGPEQDSKVKVGDRAVFATRFAKLGQSVRAKALDDRFGVAILMELVQNPPENVDLLAAFTVQEEVGLRGARVAGYALEPDLAFVLDSTPARDLPVWDSEDENTGYNTRLGAGPAIYTVDAATLSDPRLIQHLIQTAEEKGIPYQMRQPGGGGTDAGAIHRQRAGIPSVSVSVPARYLHTAASLARISDWEATLNLVWEALSSLSSSLLASERRQP